MNHFSYALSLTVLLSTCAQPIIAATPLNTEANASGENPYLSMEDYQSAVSDLLLGNIAANAGDALATAEYFESLTQSIPNEDLLMQCFNGALQSQSRKLAERCYQRLKKNIESKRSIKENATHAQLKNDASHQDDSSSANSPAKNDPFKNQSTRKIDTKTANEERLVVLKARMIALTYPEDEAPKAFLQTIKTLDKAKKRRMIVQMARFMHNLRLYSRGATFFAEVTKNEPLIEYKVFYAEFLRQTWQDEAALTVAESAFRQETSPLTLIEYVEALQQNDRGQEALALLEEFQSYPPFMDAVLQTRLEKIRNLRPEPEFQTFLETIETSGLIDKIKPEVALLVMSRWFELKNYDQVLKLTNRLEQPILATGRGRPIALLTYLKGASLLALGDNSGQKLINRVIRSPRFANMERYRFWRQKVEKQGLQSVIDELMEMSKIIRAPIDYLISSRVLTENHREDVALKVLEDGLSFHDTDPSILYEAAMAAIKQKQLGKMEQWLQKAIALDPKDYNAHNALGYSWVDENIKLDEAKKHLDVAISYQPLEPIIMDSVGWYYYRRGNLETALAHLRRANALQHDPEISAHLIEVLWKKAEQSSDNKRSNALRDEAMAPLSKKPKTD